MKRVLRALGLLTCCLYGVSRAAAETGPTAEQISFFEKKIRPVLATHCYKCHAADAEKVRGELLLDTREGVRKGGETGPIIVAGNPEKSLLIKALRYKDDKLKMPKKEKLPDEVIADFEQWVKMGAPDPRDGGIKLAKPELDIEKGRKFWAFQPPQKAPPPAVKDSAWPRTEVDRFLLASLEAKGMAPVGDADRRTLLRRVYFDLIGLPPTPEQVDAFLMASVAKPQAAIEGVVDELLASPRFGERWGRHWLDVARFAESSGKAANIAYPHAWRYRDYVIASFNADKPYDQFVREQLAGDLLPAQDDKQKADQLVGTGFLAIGSKLHNERNPQQFQMDLVDEQIDATSVAFLGMTVACARCHDHKFDPIPTKDYYALAGIFRSTETCYGTIRVIQSNHPSPLVTLPKDADVVLPVRPLSAERRTTIETQIKDLREQVSKLTGADAQLRGIFLRTRMATLQSQLSLYETDGTPKPLAMGARDRSFSADGRVYVRGELDQPGERVKRGIPQVMTTKQPVIGKGSGRLELANWIASADNPLTARIMANRVWLHLFGRGLVATPDNFGASGQRPDHPALLDHLAVSFVENGWSVKKLIRSLVLSRAYQQSSEFVAKNYEVDPDNVLVWRMSKRRLEAEALRDSMLAVSGNLDLAPAKGSPLAGNGEGNINQLLRQRGPIDGFNSELHRAVYLPIIRDQLPEALTLFDFPDPNLMAGARATTTIPAQSLYLMNNPFVIRQAESVADRLLAPGDTDAQRLTRAYTMFYARPPSEKEQRTAEDFINRYTKTLTDEKKTPTQARRAAWSALCQSLFAGAEFSHR